MNLLLVVRSEIIASFIIIFLIIYDRICAQYREGKDHFLAFALVGLGHVLFGMITEITVNTSTVPHLVNDILHVFFFAFALEFSMQYLKYTLSLVAPAGKKQWYIVVARILSIISLIVMLLSDINYLDGNGTKYSAGTGPTLCYMLGFIFFTISDVILIIKRKQINKQVLFSLLPLSILGLMLMAIQIVVPEFLFTGAALTLMTLGAFLAIENPVGKFQDRAFIDINTGVWNRMAFEYDVNHIVEKKIGDGARMTFVMSDLDGLKKVNDTYGHLEGDKLIRYGAQLLSECLKSAYRIYRIGGDEFAAIYFNKTLDEIQEEIQSVNQKSGKYDHELKTKLSISIGVAEHDAQESVDDTSKKADLAMYQMKAQHHASIEAE